MDIAKMRDTVKVDCGKNIGSAGSLILEENWLKHGIPYVIQRNRSMYCNIFQAFSVSPATVLTRRLYWRSLSVWLCMMVMNIDECKSPLKSCVQTIVGKTYGQV